jgi:hypothetical protein
MASDKGAVRPNNRTVDENVEVYTYSTKNRAYVSIYVNFNE